jgi:hypothetical protein
MEAETAHLEVYDHLYNIKLEILGVSVQHVTDCNEANESDQLHKRSTEIVNLIKRAP